MSSSISLAKWMVMGVLALVSCLLGALPYFLLRKLRGMRDIFNYSAYHQSLTILSCTGGGVLLATTLVHMLPENRMSLEGNSFVLETFGDHFPTAEILTLIGFAFIYFLEEMANFIIEMTGQGAWGHGHSHHHHHHENGLDLGHLDTDKRRPSSGTISGRRRASLLSIHAASRTSIQLNLEPSPPSTPDSSVNSKAVLHRPSLNLSISEEEEEPVATSAKSQIGSLVALIALSFHAIMEGIAIGIQNSSNLWLMFGAIASHKFVISFCMGMELVAAKAKPSIYIGSIFLFAILSPIGIFIGSFLTEENATKSFPVCVLEGFTTGTLLYVVFFEILSREKERRQTVLDSSRWTGFLQFLGIVVGGTSMILLLTLTDHGHNSPEGGGEHHEGDH